MNGARMESGKDLRILQWLLAALSISVLLAAMPWVSTITMQTRFVVAFGGAGLVLVRGWGLRSGLWPAPLVVGSLFPLLCLASIEWSWAVPLTAMKASLMAAVFVVASVGGFHLGRRADSDTQILFSWAAAGLFWAGLTVVGVGLGRGFGETGFRGGTSNENMFASGAAMVSFPLSEYLLATPWSHRPWVRTVAKASPWLWGFLILLSRSRGGLVVYLIVASVWWFTGVRRRRLSWFVPVGALACSFVLLLGMPSVAGEVQGFVYKQPESGEDFFYSRRRNWIETEAAIELVGPLGAGLGVAADEPFRSDMISMNTTVGYGREQGSAWLALREQLGFPGQAVYALIGVAIVAALLRAAASTRSGHAGVARSLLWAIALGLYAVSFVEAWTVAPGSAEAAFFWTAVGQAAGAGANRELTVKLRNGRTVSARGLLARAGRWARPSLR